MFIYNTLSGKKEKLIIPKNRNLKLFVCGPTVYDKSHIGHARTYLVFDSFIKYLRSQKIKIVYLQNITDIDDKIIARAKKEKTNAKKIADKYFNAYTRDMKTLGIKSVDRYARATKFIPEIIKQVQTLIKRGYVYKIENDGWYFDVATFPDYGKLSKRTALQAEDAVTRIDESVKKRNRGEFCVWKFSKPGEPVWRASFGAGRPGWHIEDTAIAGKFFGPQYDLHGGGLDLKFPHHEAEIAQAEAASGKKPFVKIWLHTGMLTVNGKKMSKSLQNFITIKDFLKKYPAEVLRFMVLNHHYRMPLNYKNELAIQAKKNLDDINLFLAKIDFMLSKKYSPRLKKHSFNFPTLFENALANDFNTPEAISYIFNAINQGNDLYKKYNWAADRKGLLETKKFINNSLAKLGIVTKKHKIPQKIKKIAAERELLRRNKQFIRADTLRKKIRVLGYAIEDTPLGPFIQAAS